MKRLIFTAMLCIAASYGFAQTTTTTTTTITTDSAKHVTDTTIVTKKRVRIKLGIGNDVPYVSSYDTSAAVKPSKAPGFSFGVTFSRIDLGFATILDHGSFTYRQKTSF